MDLWEPKRRIESRYRQALREINKYIETVISGIEDPSEIVAALKNMFHMELFNQYSRATATQMVTSLFTDAGRTWRQAARTNAKGRAVYEALMRELKGPTGARLHAQIRRNAAVIKTMPLNYATSITDYIARETMKGRRASDIAKEIKLKFPESSKAKAALIARTEVSKTSTALTQARAENLGIQWYVWRTSKDSRVRDSHRLMDGVLVKWGDPPSPEALDGEKHIGYYNAGDIFNCRCYPEPLVNIDTIQWPHKVYRNGSISMITKAEFLKIA